LYLYGGTASQNTVYGNYDGIDTSYSNSGYPSVTANRVFDNSDIGIHLDSNGGTVSGNDV
jgi:parallel beta-helix repeat protein